MSKANEKLENERNQLTKMTCIDYATRVVGKPIYIFEEKKEKHIKYHEDVVEIAKKIYEFVK